MNEYKRKFPLFSLCGLNCGLCPRYNVSTSSQCPGCGGEDFHLKHPTCSVITCNKKHDNVEFCFQCSCYPCEKYANPSAKDSFITYMNVINDFQKAKDKGIDFYKSELKEKMEILLYLLNQYNDGRKKSYYCNAVNLLDIEDLQDIMEYIKLTVSIQEIGKKEKIKVIIDALEEKALKNNIQLSLRD